jgi:hypothetical protein
MFSAAQWIGIPKEEYRQKQIIQGDANGRFAYFRLDFDAVAEGCGADIEISASSRYRLWVNGRPIGSGPCRGDRFRHFVDRRSLRGCFRNGRNTICVQVLLCDFNAIDTFGVERMPLISVADVPAGHRLALEGAVTDQNGATHSLTTGEADWRVWLDNTFYLKKLPVVSDNMGAMIEQIDFTRTFPDWKEPGFDASGWTQAHAMESAVRTDFMKFVGFLPPLVSEDRTIPLLFEEKEALIAPEAVSIFPLRVEARSSLEVTIPMKYHANVYPRYFFTGGKDAKISFTYFERFMEKDAAEGKVPDANRVKRDDSENGVIPPAVTDTVILSGGKTCYEPFWYRTLRFLKISITTEDEPVALEMPELRRTGYPLNPEADISSSAPWVKELFDICQRTLQNCMTDAYMDCPYYEQMQYPMDTRLQAAFTYVISRDTALARKALEDFHASMTPYGFVQGRAPSGYTQIISTFSFFYIRMLLEYWERTGDLSVLRRYRSDCDVILDAFSRYLDPKTGLLGKTEFWDFVDWQTEWLNNTGRPTALETGPSSLLTLMLCGCLEDAASIYELTGDAARAQTYRTEKEKLLQNVRATCFDPWRGMIREGPACQQFCQLTQSRAVLTGLLQGDEARRALRHCVEDPDALQNTFSASFEFFRACEMAGCYDLTEKQLGLWKGLLNEHCTTVPETPANSRSECHGWSALPIYELFRVRAGIRQVPGQPGKFTVQPHLGDLTDLEGSLPMPGGRLDFHMQKTLDGVDVKLHAPEGVQVDILPS